MSKLRTWQRDALRAAEAAERGVIQAIMGAGKSVVIAELAAREMRQGHHVVVTVPTQELVRQLARSISAWTGQVVGTWYAESRDLWPCTVVCQPSIETYEAAWRDKYDAPERFWIADECHRTECDTVLAWSAPDRRIGLTATPWRAEMSRTISLFDEVVYEYGADRAHEDGHIVKPTLCHPEPGDVDDQVCAWIERMRRHGGGVVNASSIRDARDFAARLDAICVHSESEHDADMARAVIRDGGVVVYVDMLAEGFDCPEIMWMALRRPVGSRVRFAQEVGRGLRAAPGKTTCHMLDVWDLWGTHSMDWRAALGETDSAVVPALQLDMVVEQVAWKPLEERMPPEVLGPLRGWIRHERVQAMFEGRVAGKEIKSRSWRSDPCSRRQLLYLDQVMCRLNPAGLDPDVVRRVRMARAALVDSLGRDAADLAGALRKGDASDLIDVVRGLGV